MNCDSLCKLATVLSRLPPAAAGDYLAAVDLLRQAVDAALQARPDLPALIGTEGTDGIEAMDANHVNHARFMTSVFAQRDAAPLIDTMIYIYSSYISRGFSPNYFHIELECWAEAVTAHVPLGSAGAIGDVYRTMIDCYPALVSQAAQEPEGNSEVALDDRARRLLEALLALDAGASLAHARGEIAGPEAIPGYWTQVMAPALHELGRRWERGLVSVGQKHLATAIAQQLMTVFYPMILGHPRPRRGCLVLTVSPGELHEVGPRMVADCLELDGWNVIYTGASMPTDGIAALLHQHGVNVLAVGTTMYFNIPQTERLIAQVRHQLGRPLTVIVGGRAFAGNSPWSSIGADLFAPDANTAVAMLRHHAT